MNWKELSKKFLFGGFVKYKGRAYAVVALNDLKKTCTLETIDEHRTKIPDVSLSNLDYDDITV